MPPGACACAITCKPMVVLPDDSGPKISTTRPRGTPPTPSAASNEIAPVEITEIGTMASFDPSRMIDPFPNCFSICANARSIARARSSAMDTSPVRTTILGLRLEYTAYAKRIKGESQNISGKVPENELEKPPTKGMHKAAENLPRRSIRLCSFHVPHAEFL